MWFNSDGFFLCFGKSSLDKISNLQGQLMFFSLNFLLKKFKKDSVPSVSCMAWDAT